MINKFKNWIKNHRYITAAGLFLVSICAIAFGFAQFGPQNDIGVMDEDDSMTEEELDTIIAGY